MSLLHVAQEERDRQREERRQGQAKEEGEEEEEDEKERGNLQEQRGNQVQQGRKAGRLTREVEHRHGERRGRPASGYVYEGMFGDERSHEEDEFAWQR